MSIRIPKSGIYRDLLNLLLLLRPRRILCLVLPIIRDFSTECIQFNLKWFNNILDHPIKWIKIQYASITSQILLSSIFLSEILHNKIKSIFSTKYVTIMIVTLTKCVHVFYLPNIESVVDLTYIFCACFNQKKKCNKWLVWKLMHSENILIHLIPDDVVTGIFSVTNRHPSTGSQNSLEHFGWHLPPHFSPKLPGGQDLLQSFPKYPGLHAAKWIFF